MEIKSYTEGWNNAIDRVIQMIDESGCVNVLHKSHPCKNHPKIINSDNLKFKLKQEMRE